MPAKGLAVSAEDVFAAAERIAPFVNATPVLRSRTLDQLTGARLFFKCENFQRTGSFKFRGACNAVLSLDSESAARGVLTHSSGNHGAALALAAQIRGVPVHLVVPDGANPAKLAAVERYGARIVRCAASMEARARVAAELAAATGAVLVHPYDDPRVIAGQGTVALELLREVGPLDYLVAPVGGGGLLSGSAVLAKHMQPSLQLIGAEPAGADDAARSLAAGVLLARPQPETICDGLRASLGSLPFAVLRATQTSVVTVDDTHTCAAMRWIYEVLKVVVEPSAAIALAAALQRRFEFPRAARIGVLLSGGNADLDALPWMLPKPAAPDRALAGPTSAPLPGERRRARGDE